MEMSQSSNKTPAQIEAQENLKSAVTSKNERLQRRPDVEARTGLSRSTIYDWMKRGEFPQPVKLGTRLVAWRESDITAWLESRETRGA